MGGETQDSNHHADFAFFPRCFFAGVGLGVFLEARIADVRASAACDVRSRVSKRLKFREVKVERKTI